MTSPNPDQPARADRRTLPYPGDEAITAARDRAHQAFAQLFTALGAGRHRLHYAAVDVDGRYALASATVDVTTAPAWHLDADPDEFTVIEAAVTAALEGSCTVQAARSLAAWWTLARWFTARPHPVLALLLVPDRESLAHRAAYLPKWAEISTRAAEAEGRRLTLFRSEYEGLARPAAAPESRDRPYFVVGQWKGGGDVDIWHVEEAPADPGELSDLCEQHTVDAEDAFGSVEIVYAASPETAAEQARREARETSERIHRELTHP